MKKILNLIKSSAEDFARNKVRTALTSLGILVGVLAVVMLIALGLGLKNYLKQQFENLGANLLVVFPGQGVGSNFGQSFTSLANAIKFDERDYRSLSRISSIDYVVPGYTGSFIFESENNKKQGSLMGVSEEYKDIFNLELIAGEFFGRSDVSSSSKVGVVAEGLANDLFGNYKNAVGRTVQAKTLRIKIIGVVKNVGDPDQDTSISVPYTTTYSTVNPDKEFNAIYLGVKDDSLVFQAKDEAEKILLKRYEDDQFSVIESSEILESIGQIFNIVNGILVAIGSISLLVGGIGIMNIMYANVTERTKEIGIRRAIGAKEEDIMLQFLAESTILSLIGGFSGLIIATIIVLLVRPFFPLEINLVAVSVALGISSLIGIFFGVFPARRAASLTPIEAIRYE